RDEFIEVLLLFVERRLVSGDRGLQRTRLIAQNFDLGEMTAFALAGDSQFVSLPPDLFEFVPEGLVGTSDFVQLDRLVGVRPFCEFLRKTVSLRSETLEVFGDDVKRTPVKHPD